MCAHVSTTIIATEISPSSLHINSHFFLQTSKERSVYFWWDIFVDTDAHDLCFSVSSASLSMMEQTVNNTTTRSYFHLFITGHCNGSNAWNEYNMKKFDFTHTDGFWSVSREKTILNANNKRQLTIWLWIKRVIKFKGRKNALHIFCSCQRLWKKKKSNYIFVQLSFDKCTKKSPKPSNVIWHILLYRNPFYRILLISLTKFTTLDSVLFE